MKDHYSFISPVYNTLAKLVFGSQLKLSKTCFLEGLSAKKILIIGGGDGLDYKAFQKQLQGEYWELSQSMLSLAKSNLKDSRLSFHLGVYHLRAEIRFDEIWLHFVLDTLSDEEIDALLVLCKKSLNQNGGIYLADFFEAKTGYQRFVSKAMIQFFKIVTAHKREDIPNYEQIFQRNGLKKTSEKLFMKGWVKAQIWNPESF